MGFLGNLLRFLYGQCFKPSADSDSIGHHGISTNVSTLAHDLYNFEISSQVSSFAEFQLLVHFFLYLNSKKILSLDLSGVFQLS